MTPTDGTSTSVFFSPRWEGNNDDTLFVHLPVRYSVTGVVTQGGGASGDWVTRYELKYTADGVTWLEHYQDDDSTVMVRHFACSLCRLQQRRH